MNEEEIMERFNNLQIAMSDFGDELEKLKTRLFTLESANNQTIKVNKQLLQLLKDKKVIPNDTP